MLSGSVLDGKYQIVRRLGEGGMGNVYEGRHLGTGRRLAIKVVPAEVLAKGPDIVSRFRLEAKAAGAIESPHVAGVLDVGVDASTGSPYLVMELLVGEDVSQALRRVGRFPPEIALRVAAQACAGLQKAHEAGVVHRDVKPANLFLVRREGEAVVKVLDFGIAKVRVDPLGVEAADMTRPGAMLGSPLYMSPEQARGRRTVDHRADLFSLGVVLYECLSGRAPHAGADTIGDLVVRICGEAAKPLKEVAPWVSAPVAAIVHKAIAIDPDARYASAADMLAAIRAQLPAGTALDDKLLAALGEPKKPVASRPSVVPEPQRTPQPAARPPADLARTTAQTPSSKDPKVSTPSAGAARRAATPSREATREAMEKRIFVPAARKAAVLLWGEDGLNAIAQTLQHDTREEFFRPVSTGEWVPARMVIDWCYQVFEGPANHDLPKMREYLDRTFDYSFGVVRKAVLRFADPVPLVAKLPQFWRQDHVGGEMEAQLDASGKGCVIRLRDSPFTETPPTRAGMAENYRYAFSLTRAKDVTESNALERQHGKNVLVIRLKWQ